jgi:hypothetical protein
MREVKRPLFSAYCTEHKYCLSYTNTFIPYSSGRDTECALAWEEWWMRHDSPQLGMTAWTPAEGAAVVLGAATVEELVR